MNFDDYWDAYTRAVESPLCGRYVGDNDGTCPQLGCIREKGHPGYCDNTSGAPCRATTEAEGT